MKKAKLNQAFEKANSQTKLQAMRVVEMLSGVRPDPLTREKPAQRKRQKHLSPGSEKKIEGKAGTC